MIYGRAEHISREVRICSSRLSFAIDQYCVTPVVRIDAFTVGESGKDTSGEDTWVQKISMSLQSRISRLERIYQAELNHRHKDKGLDHDSLTGDNLIRIWAGGADDWVCRRMENVIERCEGIAADAKTRLQQKLKILQTGNPEEVLLVIAGLCRDTPEWISARESNLLATNSNGNPAMAKAIAKYGIRRDGRRDWAGFARWLDERILKKNGSDSMPAEFPHAISEARLTL
jgi:hypothetical protein